MKIHNLTRLSMERAYDLTQTSDQIRSGDLLWTRDGWAIMDRAWPVMVDNPSEVFHMVKAERVSAWRSIHWEAIEMIDLIGDNVDALEFYAERA